jgi:hypothetical protein
VDHDLGFREHRGDVSHPAGVVKVNMGDHDSGQVPRPDAQAGECVPDHRCRRRGARLDQARPLRPDQVPGGDLVVAGHPGVDLEHLMPERGDAIGGRAAFCLDHGVIVPEPDETDRYRPGAASSNPGAGAESE